MICACVNLLNQHILHHKCPSSSNITTPTSVATSPNNTLWQRGIFHELAVSYDNHQASCSHMQWPSILRQHSTNGKITRPHIHLKRFVKLRKVDHER